MNESRVSYGGSNFGVNSEKSHESTVPIASIISIVTLLELALLLAIGAGASTGIGTLLALALALVLVLAIALELGQALAQKASPASAALAAACETWTAWEQYTTRHMQGGQRITETMTHKRVALQR